MLKIYTGHGKNIKPLKLKVIYGLMKGKLHIPTKGSVEGKSGPDTSHWVCVRDQNGMACICQYCRPLDRLCYADLELWKNRLYQSTWMKREGDLTAIKIGLYRHSSGLIYKKPGQIWPLYRRHIFLTTKAMTGNVSIDELAPQELRLYETESSLPQKQKLPYLSKDY